jgi:beta-lactamase regulating signal transducer with metallopeptidase domain
MSVVSAAALTVLAVKATVLVAMAIVLARLLASRSAASRHVVWAATLAALIVLPAAMPLAPSISLRILPARAIDRGAWQTERSASPPRFEATASATAATGEALPRRPIVGHPRSSASVPAAQRQEAPPTIDQLLSAVWLAGALAVITRFLAALAAARNLVRRSTIVDTAAWNRDVADVALALRLESVPRVVASPEVPVPVTTGILDPVIVVPMEAQHWPADRRRTVLLHELAHVRRRDTIVQGLQYVACAVHWWNPLAWHASRRLAIERERACDDLVLAAGMPGIDYAAHLVDIARQALGGRPMTAAALAMARPSELEGRIMAMLDSGKVRGRVTHRMLAGAAAAVLATAGVMASISLEPRLSAAVLPADAAAGPAAAPAAAQAPRTPAASPAPQPARTSPEPSTPQPKPSPAPRAGAAMPVTVPPAEGVIGGMVDGAVEAAIAEAQADAGAQGRVPVVAGQKPGRGNAGEHAVSEAVRESVTAALLTALGDKDPDVRKQALFALRGSSSPKLLDPMLSALKDADPEVREQAAFALGRYRDDPRVVAALEGALKDSVAGVRQHAAFSLGQIGSDRAAQALVTALSDKEAEVRAQAAFALGQVGGPNIVDALKTALSDADPEVRANAAFALGRIIR